MHNFVITLIYKMHFSKFIWICVEFPKVCKTTKRLNKKGTCWLNGPEGNSGRWSVTHQEQHSVDLTGLRPSCGMLNWRVGPVGQLLHEKSKKCDLYLNPWHLGRDREASARRLWLCSWYRSIEIYLALKVWPFSHGRAVVHSDVDDHLCDDASVFGCMCVGAAWVTVPEEHMRLT